MDNGLAITLKLKNIILKSEEVLTQLETQLEAQLENSAKNSTNNHDENDASNEDLLVAPEHIQALLKERNTLITRLFEEYDKSELEKCIDLLNTILDFDSQLKEKSKALQQHFASQLLKLKKGKKLAYTYQK